MVDTPLLIKIDSFIKIDSLIKIDSCDAMYVSLFRYNSNKCMFMEP